MTGCEPTEVKCRCDCHRTGIKMEILSMPGKPCCDCQTGIFMVNNNPKKCRHGSPEFGCYYCDLEKSIEALEKHKHQQIDENRAVFRKLEELEDWYKQMFNDLFYKIEALEKKSCLPFRYLEDREQMEIFFKESIFHLEQERDKGIERLKDLEESYQGLKKEVDWLHDESFIQKMFYQYEQRLEALELNSITIKKSGDGVVTITPNGKSLEVNCESNLSQQNSVIVKAQDGIEIENYHLAPKIECKRCDKLLSDGLHTCTPKTVTIFEAIKALRDGKKIIRECWAYPLWIENGEGDLCVNDLLADDWVIEDEDSSGM